jgi:hypothetical protein
MGMLGLLPCGFVALGFAVLLAVVDVRTGRGYALGVLSSLLLACTIVVVVTVTIAAQLQPQPPNIHNGSVALLLVFYFIPAVYATAVTLIGGGIVAGISGHWQWLGGFIVAALVPVLLAVPPHPFLDMNTDYVVRNVGFLGMLVAPEAAVLVYSVMRFVHPVAPTSARRFAPPE